MPENAGELSADFHSEPTIATRRIYEGNIINVRVDTVRMPSGRDATLSLIHI